jgi:glycosyltransferase involved in cell wall biosynthesis
VVHGGEVMKMGEEKTKAPYGAGSGHEPLVSVIMPAYNTSRYIREAIDSVLDQDYGNKELIVIDDGSTDGTLDIVRSYGDRLQLITQQNQGSAVARNAGLAAACGEYIAFLDSDDVWLPGKLSLQVRYLQDHPDIGMIYARWQVWKPGADGRFSPAASMVGELAAGESLADGPGVVDEQSGWLYNRLLFTSLLHTITVLARRELVETVGRFNADLKRGQDYDYWLRTSRVTEIRQLDRVLALYRVHGEGCVTKWPQQNYEKLVVEGALQRWGLEGPTGEQTPRAAIERRLGEICFTFGYYHYWQGSPRIALRSFREALRHRPWHPASWRYLVMSMIKARTAAPTASGAQ